ncbi:hypothetical protein U1Q18_014726, partial [Sarracenia purpurea var. burkii]
MGDPVRKKSGFGTLHYRRSIVPPLRPLGHRCCAPPSAPAPTFDHGAGSALSFLSLFR